MTKEGRKAHLLYLIEHGRVPGESTSVFIDSLLEVMPDFIEDRKALAQPIKSQRSYGHLDEYPELTRQCEDDAARVAQDCLYLKRERFAKVEIAFEKLREAIRAYYREVEI